jgi:predicted secreted protein
MTTNARIGAGNLFQLFDQTVSPAAWITIGEVKNITPPSFARDAVDATHTESPEAWREFIPGLKDGGEITAELNLVPDSDSTEKLLGTFDSDELQQVRILFKDGVQTGPTPTCSRFTASGIVTGLPLEAPIDGVMAATVTLKVSGKPTFVRSTA